MNKKILFFGELAPNIVHGGSLLNSLNINILKKYYIVEEIEEQAILSQHQKRNFTKMINVFNYVKSIYILNQKYQYKYYYSVFAFSTFGSFKTLLCLFGFKISGNGNTVLFIYRGDFFDFYKRSILNKIICNIILRFTDKLVVMSKKQKKELSCIVVDKRIFILGNSLSEEFVFDKRRYEARRFVYISNYIKEKGIFELLETFKNLKSKSDGLILECFGGFTSDQEKIKILDYNSSKIKINTFIGGAEKFKKINEADCLILPSWNEGQPTVILEAMSQGTIVLTTKVGLIGEMLGEDYPFYFDSKNMDSLEKCIEKFISYENKAILAEKLKNNYRVNFSSIMHEKKLLMIFE